MPVQKALRDMHRSMTIQNLIIMILLSVLTFVVFIDRHNDSERRQRDAQRLVDARVEACHASNSDKQLERTFQVDNILTLSQLTGRNEGDVKNDPRFIQYVQFVDKSFPFRQCSQDCVIAFYDASIPDCPQGSNENGDP